MEALLQVKGLIKQYPETRAVDGIAFDIPAGSCFGLLGPNGAGKTTTLEMLEGITDEDEGEILFRGAIRNDSYREKIGIQFQHTALQDFQTVAEALRLFASFYPKTRSEEELIRLCQLQDILKRDTRRLSGGQRQRLLLAIALVNDPELVFLDEPTTGLDPQSRRNFWDLIQGIREEGKTILLTTHYMEEASVLCDEIAVMDKGRIIEQGQPQALLREHFPHTLMRLPLSAFTDKEQIPEGADIRKDHVDISTKDVQANIDLLGSRGVDLGSLQVFNPTLEDLFLKLTGHALRS